ncbi:MAG: hypothetical protein ACPGOY_07950 [Rhodospirillaceae bacterium]
MGLRPPAVPNLIRVLAPAANAAPAQRVAATGPGPSHNSSAFVMVVEEALP